MKSDSFHIHLNNWFLRKTGTVSVRRIGELPIAIASNIGKVRKENEDRVAVLRFSDMTKRQFILVAVCDGMGGMEDGAICAAMALSMFFSEFLNSGVIKNPEFRLRQSAMAANQAVYQKYRGKGGSTLSAVLLIDNEDAWTVNVGDSRIYGFGKEQLTQLTVDDTLAGQMARDPSAYSGRGELLQYIGVGPMAEPHVEMLKDSSDQAALMISSDGVHLLPLDVIQKIMAYAGEPAIAARRLVDLATWCGGHDNASVAILYHKLAFPEISANSDTSIAEVWDPFGEVQFVNIRSSANQIEHENPQSVGADSVAKDDLIDQLPTPVLVKKKRASKSKNLTKKKGIRPSNDPGESSLEIPQLMINFRKKGDLQ